MVDQNSVKILVIDDEAIIRRVFSFYLEEKGFSVLTAENGRQGLELIEKEQPNVVLTDLRMPQLDGLELLARIKKMSEEIPVIVISGAQNMEYAVQALKLGAWDYLMKPVQDLNLLGYTVDECLEKARLIKENQNYRENLEDLVEERTKKLALRNQQLDLSRRQIIGILSQAAEYKDFETGNHFLRVSEMVACIARGLNWDEDRVVNLQLAAPVHDIGKIGIPDNVLLKPGKLDAKEWTLMKNHCLFGKNILESSQYLGEKDNKNTINISNASYILMETASNIALSHHEFWNGNGYPMGIKGKHIPIEARITTVADVYDALLSKRPYKDPWPEEKALDYIKDKSGQQFDPEIVRVFFENINQIRNIQINYR